MDEIMQSEEYKKIKSTVDEQRDIAKRNAEREAKRKLNPEQISAKDLLDSRYSYGVNFTPTTQPDCICSFEVPEPKGKDGVKATVKKPVKKSVKKPVKKAVKKPVKKAVKKPVKKATKKVTKK